MLPSRHVDVSYLAPLPHQKKKWVVLHKVFMLLNNSNHTKLVRMFCPKAEVERSLRFINGNTTCNDNVTKERNLRLEDTSNSLYRAWTHSFSCAVITTVNLPAVLQLHSRCTPVHESLSQTGIFTKDWSCSHTSDHWSNSPVLILIIHAIKVIKGNFLTIFICLLIYVAYRIISNSYIATLFNLRGLIHATVFHQQTITFTEISPSPSSSPPSSSSFFFFSFFYSFLLRLIWMQTKNFIFCHAFRFQLTHRISLLIIRTFRTKMSPGVTLPLDTGSH